MSGLRGESAVYTRAITPSIPWQAFADRRYAILVRCGIWHDQSQEPSSTLGSKPEMVSILTSERRDSGRGGGALYDTFVRHRANSL